MYSIFHFATFFPYVFYHRVLFFPPFFIKMNSYFTGEREMASRAPELLSSLMLQIMTKLQLLKDTKWN